MERKHLCCASACLFVGPVTCETSGNARKGRSASPKNSSLIPQLTKQKIGVSLGNSLSSLNTSYHGVKNGQRKTSAPLILEMSF